VPPEAVPSRPAVAALHSALRAMLAARRAQGPSSDGLRLAVRTICQEAHGAGLPAERMLTVFKAALHACPEVQRLRDRCVREELLGRIVSVCIREYYARRS
jgi:hypothetical protein